MVLAKMHEKRVEKALSRDDEFHLIGVITMKDFQKAREHKPNACKDEQGRLRVGAAVGAGAGNEERLDALVAAGVDVLLIDSSVTQKAFCRRIRETRAKISGSANYRRQRGNSCRCTRFGRSWLQRG
ncbi:IMP dehydrogenase [Escherichia coli]